MTDVQTPLRQVVASNPAWPRVRAPISAAQDGIPVDGRRCHPDGNCHPRDLEPHLLNKERVLFQALRDLPRGRIPVPFGVLSDPVRMMLLEHDRAGNS